MKESGPEVNVNTGRAWSVVKPLANYAYQVKLADVFRFGRVKLRVAQIGAVYAQPYPPTM